MVFFTLFIAIAVMVVGGAIIATTEERLAGAVLVVGGLIAVMAGSISIEYERNRFHESIRERIGQ